MTIKIKLLSNEAFMPERATNGSAAYDVFCPSNKYIDKGRHIIPLDFAIELPKGYEAKIEPRSSNSAKGFADNYGTRFDADVLIGKIDSDYRGNVGVIIKNNDNVIHVGRGQRIAQLTIYKVEDADFEICDTLSDTNRGDGGFGSTGM